MTPPTLLTFPIQDTTLADLSPAERAQVRTRQLTYPEPQPRAVMPNLSGKGEAERAALLNTYNADLTRQEQASAAYDQALRDYRTAEGVIRQQFAADLHREYAPELTPQSADAIFEQAWQDGHSSGYSDVEQAYSTLISVVLRCLDAERVRA